MLNTPVLFLVFNRLDTTKRVFHEIRNVKPTTLFIAADGPRSSKPEEKQICEEIRTWILQNVDWPCKVETLFRSQNLGCGKAVSEAITWFFSQVNRGIILEDDTLPNESFFSFCAKLLADYENNLAVAGITGCNYGLNDCTSDDFFLGMGSVWGWASWANRWSNYQFDIRAYEEERHQFAKWVCSRELEHYFYNMLQANINNRINTWDVQWVWSYAMKQQYFIHPRLNLITNIGFGLDGTHTTKTRNNQANLRQFKMDVSNSVCAVTDINIDFQFRLQKLFVKPKQPNWLLFIKRQILAIFNSGK